VVGGRRRADERGAPYVPEVAAKQHFYMILSNQTHGAKVPYDMFVTAVRAYVPRTSKVPAVAPRP